MEGRNGKKRKIGSLYSKEIQREEYLLAQGRPIITFK